MRFFFFGYYFSIANDKENTAAKLDAFGTKAYNNSCSYIVKVSQMERGTPRGCAEKGKGR